MQNFISNIWNAYTLIDVVLILLFALLSLYYFKLFKQAKTKLKNYQFYSTVSAQTIEDYDYQIKQQESQIEDRKKYFEDAVVEITKLRSKNKALTADLSTMSENLIYWKERALHYKHTKKVKPEDSESYECLEDILNYFIKGNTYNRSNKLKGMFGLVAENGKHYVVNSTQFKPVQK